MLYHGDCLEEMNKIPDGSVDLVLTDPPYGTTACKWDSVIPFEPLWAKLHRVAKRGAAIALFGSEPFSSALRMSNIAEFRYDWIWLKNRPSGFANAKYKPMTTHEVVSVFYKDSPTFYPIKEERDLKPKYNKLKEGGFTRNNYGSETQAINGKLGKTYDGLRNPTTVQKFDTVSNNKGSRVHPTQKPVDLLEYLILTYTRDGETVLDFTMGSGSTGVACVNTGRKFIGIELADNYYSIAYNRIKEAQHIVV